MNNYQPDGNNSESVGLQSFSDALNGIEPQEVTERYTLTSEIFQKVMDQQRNQSLSVDLNPIDSFALEIMPLNLLFAAGFFAGVYLQKQRSGN